MLSFSWVLSTTCVGGEEVGVVGGGGLCSGWSVVRSVGGGGGVCESGFGVWGCSSPAPLDFPLGAVDIAGLILWGRLLPLCDHGYVVWMWWFVSSGRNLLLG